MDIDMATISHLANQEMWISEVKNAMLEHEGHRMSAHIQLFRSCNAKIQLLGHEQLKNMAKPSETT